MIVLAYIFAGLSLLLSFVLHSKTVNRPLLFQNFSGVLSMNENLSVFRSEAAEKAYLAAYDHSLESWPVPYESKYISTSYGETHVLISGPEDGKSIVLMHGKAGSATNWYANVSALSDEHRVYALDILGDVGKSTVTKSYSNRSEFADWLTQVLDELAVQKTDMIGESMGSYLTINYALERPDRLNKIALLAPAATFSSFTKSFMLGGMSSSMLGFDFLIKRYIRTMTDNAELLENDAIKQSMLGLKSWRISKERPFLLPERLPDEDLLSLKVPTLLAVGENDVANRDSPTAVAERAKKLVAHVQTVIVPGAGHMLSMSKPEQINSMILVFLSD